MTRLEFAKGWLFLTAQPWGKTYRTIGQTSIGGEPSPADIQSEFYYKALSAYDAVIWLQACQMQAEGEHWPSLETLRQCMRGLTPAIKATIDPSTWMTKEQFGVNLFEVIKTISGLHALRAQLNVAVHAKQGTKELTARYHASQEYLANQLPALTDVEMAQVLARYPDVVTL